MTDLTRDEFEREFNELPDSHIILRLLGEDAVYWTLRALTIRQLREMIDNNALIFDPHSWAATGSQTAASLVTWSQRYRSFPAVVTGSDSPVLQAVLSAAQEWAYARNALDGTRDGSIRFESRGQEVLFDLARDLSWEALDVALESNDVAPVHGYARQRPSLLKLQNDWESWRRENDAYDAIITWARTMVRHYSSNLPNSMTLFPQVTLGVARELYARLLSLAVQGPLSFTSPSEFQPVMVPNRRSLMLWLTQPSPDYSLISTAAVTTFIDRLTWDFIAPPIVKPLIPYKSGLIIAFPLLHYINYERNLLRLSASSPADFGTNGNEIGKRASAWAQRLRRLPDVVVAEEVKLFEKNGKAASDLDIVAVDNASGIGLVIEAKHEIDAQSVKNASTRESGWRREASRKDAIARRITDGDLDVRLPNGFPPWSTIRWTWILGTSQQLPPRDLGAEFYRPASLRLYDRDVPKSLQEACDRLAYPLLPRLGQDFRYDQVVLTRLWPLSVRMGLLSLDVDADYTETRTKSKAGMQNVGRS